MDHSEAVAQYEELSAEFTALNKECNKERAEKGALSDALELKLFRAEKALAQSYAQQAALHAKALGG